MKSKTQEFSERVVAEILGVDMAVFSDTPETAAASLEKATAEKGLDPMALLEVVIQVVMTIIGSCPQDREGVRTAISRTSLFNRARARMVVSQVCTSCVDPAIRQYAGRIADSLLKRAAGADNTSAYAVIDECLPPDNWI